ncbi:MAG: polysaccharide biosynthesis/export family protein [Rhodospirillum sp.]|nr:polysaccharide biosynthesis/export family protein [Rhodospirillum sp.]MCF8488107.1 polysaccharide biosynthesis/export family protein [Rhodospirillum sp.]MCF8501280.1 polysaccharide biosynthesis/export family protein [Rhodospirillum sp.]
MRRLIGDEGKRSPRNNRSRNDRLGLGLVLFGLLGLMVLLSACGGPTFDQTTGEDPVYISEFSDAEKEVMRQTLVKSLQRGRAQYTPRIGDQLEVLFHARPTTVKTYDLQVGDQVAITFPGDTALNTTAKVRPDGWISLPETGEVMAAGRDVRSLNAAVRAKYGEVFQNSNPSVSLEGWILPEDRFIQDIESITQGRAKVVPVTSDGMLALPYLSPIQATDKTLDKLTEEVSTAYARSGLNIDVSILPKQTGGDRLFVFGEVRNPGMVETNRPQTVLMSIARAGGIETTGNLTNVRVLYVDDQGQPHLRRVNLSNVLTNLALEEDITLPDNAIVYVPPSKLAQAGRLMDQVLRQILFFQGFSGSFSYELFRQNGA